MGKGWRQFHPILTGDLAKPSDFRYQHQPGCGAQPAPMRVSKAEWDVYSLLNHGNAGTRDAMAMIGATWVGYVNGD